MDVIGEPYEGDNFEWNSDNWKYKKVKAVVKHELQKQDKWAGKPKAVISEYILNENEIAQEESPL